MRSEKVRNARSGHTRRPQLRLVEPSTKQLGKSLREKSERLRAQITASLGEVRLLIQELQRTIQQAQELIAPDDVLLGKLTPREVTVLSLIAGGFGTKQIAQLLGITFKTAVTHRTHLMHKLEMHDVATLTRFAIRTGVARL